MVDDGVNTLILVIVELILTVGGNPKEALDKVSLGLDKLANKYLKMALLRFLFWATVAPVPLLISPKIILDWLDDKVSPVIPLESILFNSVIAAAPSEPNEELSESVAVSLASFLLT